MVAVGEHGNAHVAENEILGEKVEKFEDLTRSRFRLRRQVVVRVMRLKRTIVCILTPLL